MHLLLALTLLAAPQNPVRGSVTDPDARAIAGARVELTCGVIHTVTDTDTRGTFTVNPSNDGPCVLRVSHPGFTDVTRELPTPRQILPEIEIRMALSRRREAVDVYASRPGPARAASGMLDAAALTPERLGVTGPDMTRWLALAERASGNPIGTRDIRVNGLQAAAPSTTDTITSVRVANDPFSTEFSGADRFQIDITTEPSRRWQLSASPGIFTAGHRDVLLATASQRSQNRAASASGPLSATGRLRMNASVSDAQSHSVPTYLDAATQMLSATVASSAETRGGSAGLAGWFGPLAIQSSFAAADTHISNGGVGGRSGPADALAIVTSSRVFQTTWRQAADRWTMRGGLSVSRQRQHTSAMARGVGRVLADQLISGAPDSSALADHSTSWQARAVIESASGTPADWLAGVESSSSEIDAARTFNPDGILILTSPTAIDGARLNRPGDIGVTARTTNAAVFGQRVLVASDRVWFRLGARADWQRHYGTALAPRAALGVQVGGLLIGANAGLFADPWSSSAEMERQFRLASPRLTVSSAGRVWPVTMTGAPLRRSDTVLRASIIRPLPNVLIALEETWTRGRHLTGLVRSEGAGALVDTLNTSRSMSRWLTHVRVDVTRGGWTTTAHYEFANARDNTDGLFSWPARQGDVASEWGPSSSIPRHALTAVVSGTAGHGVQLLLSARFASGTPYSLITGLDPDGLFTFSGRAGASRNLERLPASRDVSTYASRTFRLPFSGLVIDAGVRLENIFGRVTPLDVERLASSPYAGRPLSAAPGRTMSVWATFGRR